MTLAHFNTTLAPAVTSLPRPERLLIRPPFLAMVNSSLHNLDGLRLGFDAHPLKITRPHLILEV